MPTILKIKRMIDNDVWKINFELDVLSLPENDKDLIRKFGEPQINIGGVFLASTPDEYTLPDKYIRVRSDLPFTQEFDSKSPDFSSNTQAKALAFQDNFTSLYEASFNTLRDMVDTFTGEYLINI
jgi:hypothetical protein